ncbi:MAG TPA: PKD domain-containing protein [Tepidisphaeraceae bacterium]|nr:PKD domain-containing protein [Tepidisphaeraceae bacterium]
MKVRRRAQGTKFAAQLPRVNSSKNRAASTGAARMPRLARLRAAIETLETRDYLSVSLDSNGWTVVTPSADSRQIYVSSSGGSDNNNGLSPTTPVASINKAYSLLRNGFPDWILFKRGDTFHGNFGYFNDSGRSTQEPAVLTAYGDTSLPRPVIDAGASSAFAGGAMIQHLDMLDLSFTSSTHNPTSPNFTGQGSYGIYDLGTLNDLLIEDCNFSYFVNDISLQGTSTYGPVTNITVRRSQVLDAYNLNGNSQGMYAEQVNGLTLQDNVFDHNGWSSLVPGATANIFSHDVYLHSSDTNVTVTGNIFSNASSHGLQARGGGIVDNNLFLSDPTSLSFGLVNGSTTHPGGVSGEVIGNVFLKSRALAPTSPGGIGAQFGNLKPGGGTEVANNIFEDDTQGGSPAIQFQPGNAVANPQQEVGLNTLTVEQNVVYGWGFGLSLSNQYQPGVAGSNDLSAVVIRNNDFQNNLSGRIVSHGDVYDPRFEIWSGNTYSSSTAAQSSWFSLQGATMSYASWLARIEPTAQAATVPFVDPTRTLESYMASQGLTPTEDAYLAGVRGLSKTNWDSRYFPTSVVNYIHGGFVVNTPGVPTAYLLPPPDLTQDIAQTFTVTYGDSVGIDTTTIGNSNLVVSGPDGFFQRPTVLSVTGSGGSVVVTYGLTAPGGTWATLTNGTYVVSLGDGQVKNTAGVFIPGQALGSFQMTVNPNMDPNAPTAPASTPSNFTASPGASVIFLNWTAPGDQQGYVIQRSDDAGFTLNTKTFPVIGSATGYTDETVSIGKKYYYQLVATNSVGPSTATATINTAILPAAPLLNNIVFNDGNALRTPITSVSLFFSQPVTVDPTMLDLIQNPATSATPIATSVSNSSGDGKVWVVSWSTAVANNALADGAYTLTVHGAKITDAFGQPVGGDTTRSITVDMAPYVTASVWSHSAPPHSLSFTFSKDVSANLSLGALKVLNSSSQVVSPVLYNWNAATLTATWTFAGALPDGNYTARLSAATVTDTAGTKFDGNGDGIPGDDFIYSFTQAKPTLALTGVPNVNILIPYTLTLGAVTDPGQVVTQYIVNWGDGNSTTYTPATPGAGITSATYTYPTEVGPTHITVDVVDANGTHLAAGSLSLSVNRATVAVAANNANANVGGVYTLNLGTVVDKGQTITGYIVHWGDGSATNLGATGTSAQHTYAAAASDTIQVDVVDLAGTNLNAGTLPVRVGSVTVPLTGTYNTNASGTYRLVVGAANDPGYTPTGYTIFWGDGASTPITTPGVITHVYANPGPETITATVTDPTNPAPNGFENAGSLAITVNPPPTVPLTGSATANLNGTYTLTVNPANDPFQSPTNYLVHWGDGSTTSLLAPSTVNHVFTASGADNITVDLTDGTGTFRSAGSLPITVGNGPTVAVSGNPVANAGGIYTLNFGAASDPGGVVSGYSVHWGDGSSSSVAAGSSTATHSYAALGAKTITVDLTDGTGTYSGAGGMSLTVSNPSVTLAGKSATVQGVTYVLTVNPATDPGGTPTGYLVHWGDGSTTPLASSGPTSHTYAAAGNYLITTDLTDSTGTFVAAGSMALTVSKTPTLALTGSPNVNVGAAYTLNLGAVNDPAGTVSSYLINWGDGTSTPVTAKTPGTGDGPVTHTYNSSGTKTISVDLIDNNGTFTGAGTLKVTVNSVTVAPTVALSVPSPIVAGMPFALTVSPAVDPGQVVSGYLVHWGDGSTTPLSAAGNTSHTYAAAGPEKITVDVTDGAGTFAAAGSMNVTVNASPTVVPVGNAFANAGGTYTLNLTAAVDASTLIKGYFISWGDGSPYQSVAPRAQNITHTFLSTGKVTIVVGVNDVTGRYYNAGMLAVTVDPAPTIALSGNSSVQPGAPYTLNLGKLTDPGYTALGYAIHWGDGSAAQNVAGGVTSVTHSYANLGPQVVTVDLSDATGTWIGAGTLSLNVNSSPTVALSGNSFANAGGTYKLGLGSVVDSNGPVTGYLINWGDGSAPQSLAASALSATHTFATPGPATIIASVVDATGTYANAGSLPITISSAPTVTLSGNSTIAVGSIYTLNLGAASDPGYSPTGYIIHWGDGSQPQSVAAGTATVTHSYAAAGSKTITADLTDSTGTFAAAGKLSLTVAASPTVVLTGNSFANATGVYTLNFGTATDGNGPVTGFLVNWGDGSAAQSFPATTLTTTHTYASAGTKTIAASITDATGTYANAGSLPITVSPAPTVALSGISTANAGGLYSLKLGAVTDPGYSATGYVIHWGDGSAAQSVAAGTATVTHKFTTTGADKVTVDLTDATGTYASAGALSITVNSAPTVALTGASTATTGSSYTVTIGTPSDPGYAVTGYTIHWGDGSAAQGLAAGSTSASHTFTSAGPATITIDLTDSTGTFVSAGSLAITVGVNALPPSVALTGNANANAGGVYTLNLGAVSDPGQTPTGLIIHWGDGSAAQSVAIGTTSVMHTYASALAAKIIADITDAGGTRAGAGSLNVTINPAPKLALTGSANTTVTATYTLTLGALTDPGYAATGYIVHFGDGSAAISVPAGTTTVTHQYASPVAAKITVDVTDATGTYLAAGSLNVTVNPTPTMVLSGVSTVNTGTPFMLTLGAVTDPGQTVTGFLVHWADGGTTSLAATATSATHTYATPGTGTIKVDIIDTAGTWVSAGKLSLTVTTPVAVTPKVVGRYVYYNNSSFDGNTSAATTADFAAVATDKQALLPGQTASFANYTSYSKGINGIMVDMAGLPSGGTLTAADFSFHVGLGGSPTGWAVAPTPASIVIFRGAGSGGSDRVAITWADGAIAGKWLQIKVLATTNTKLTTADVFYFGNAPGATGTTTANPMVTSADADAVLPQESGAAVAITNAFDFNRDGLVNSLDYNIAGADQTTAATALQTFTS